MSDVSILLNSKRTASTRYAVSMWYVPADDISKARPVVGYFEESEKGDAQALVRRNANIPEMAEMHSIEEHDAATQLVLCRLKERREDVLDYYAPHELAKLDAEIEKMEASLLPA